MMNEPNPETSYPPVDNEGLATISEGIPPNGQPENIVSVESIAYKIKAENFQLLLEKNLTALGALALINQLDQLKDYMPKEDDLELLGLQFEFKDSNGNDLDHIAIYQVYYFAPFDRLVKFQPSFPGFGFDTDGFKELGNHLMYEIKQKELETDNNAFNAAYHIPNNDASIKADTIAEQNLSYKNLDYFQAQNEEQVSFVYFTKDQIYHLVKYYAANQGDIFISGIQLNLGKKLSQRRGMPKHYKAPYFTLKIEGQEGQSYNASTTATIDLEAPDIAFAHPCPPDWYTFSVFYRQIKKVNPEANVKALRREWNEAVFIGSPEDLTT